LERVLVQAIVTGKVTTDHAMKGCMRIRGIAPLILNFDGKWKLVVSFTSGPLYKRGKNLPVS
jgi:hypothetical protein